MSVPFFYGVRDGRAYGIYLDNSWRTYVDLGKANRSRYTFGAEGGQLDYYVFAGPTPWDVLRQFTDLTGKMPLPPLWSLGYQQCRWSYYPDTRVREIAREFRSRKIPCDVLYLDIDYMEGYRIFTWSGKNFPDPKGLVGELRRDGFRVAAIVDPGIKADSAYDAFRSGSEQDAFLRKADGSVFLGKVWPGICAFPDFSRSAVRDWWGSQFTALTDVGVRGFWNDMNEPSVFDVPTKTIDLDARHRGDDHSGPHAEFHNLYGLQMTEATREGVSRILGNERPFILTRAGFAGSQRYTAKWTGDNSSTWQDLRQALTMTLGLSISGQPFVGSDIGGFIGTPDGELFARWLELGVFTPLMRAHSAWDTPNKEPWVYGSEFERINRATIELRYSFLPYIYTTMCEAAETGIPAMRPLEFQYPASGSSTNGDAYLFGSDVFVAPVLDPHTTSRSVRFPPGTWYEYGSDKRHEGTRIETIEAPVDRLPFFIRGGAVVPTRTVVQHTGEAPIDPLILTVYPSSDSTVSRYYEDDGVTNAYTTGAFYRRTMSVRADSIRCGLQISPVEGSYDPGRRSVTAVFIDRPEPGRVTINGTVVARGVQAGGSDGWMYDRDRRRVILRLTETRGAVSIRLEP